MQNFLMRSKVKIRDKMGYIYKYPFFLAKEIFFYMLAFLKRDNTSSQKFILYCSPRTGSNLLRTLINSHPNIYLDTPILSHDEAKKLFFPIRYIRGHHCKAARKPVYGFKIHPYNLKYQKLDAQKFLLKFHQTGWKIIHLKRLNLVRQQVSLIIAEQRNKWADTLETPLKKFKFYIDSDELIKKTQRQETHLANEEKALEQVPHLTIAYEDELLKAEQHQKTADRIFEYLGVDSVPVKAKIVRTSTDNMVDFIENYEKIVRIISKTKYATFLDED